MIACDPKSNTAGYFLGKVRVGEFSPGPEIKPSYESHLPHSVALWPKGKQ
jgi:hypothetical protein